MYVFGWGGAENYVQLDTIEQNGVAWSDTLLPHQRFMKGKVYGAQLPCDLSDGLGGSSMTKYWLQVLAQGLVLHKHISLENGYQVYGVIRVKNPLAR